VVGDYPTVHTRVGQFCGTRRNKHKDKNVFRS